MFEWTILQHAGVICATPSMCTYTYIYHCASVCYDSVYIYIYLDLFYAHERSSRGVCSRAERLIQDQTTLLEQDFEYLKQLMMACATMVS